MHIQYKISGNAQAVMHFFCKLWKKLEKIIIVIYEFSELGSDYKITLSLPDGSYFSGESKNGNLFGTSSLSDGTAIKGQVINKDFEGFWEITYQNGNVYKGFLKESSRHGNGSVWQK